MVSLSLSLSLSPLSIFCRIICSGELSLNYTYNNKIKGQIEYKEIKRKNNSPTTILSIYPCYYYCDCIINKKVAVFIHISIHIYSMQWLLFLSYTFHTNSKLHRFHKIFFGGGGEEKLSGRFLQIYIVELSQKYSVIKRKRSFTIFYVG